jgi:putative iron-dependent peroxidase
MTSEDYDPNCEPEVASCANTVAQAVFAPLTRAAIFLVVTVNSGSDSRAAVRSFCGDLAGLVRAVDFRDIEGGLPVSWDWSRRMASALW